MDAVSKISKMRHGAVLQDEKAQTGVELEPEPKPELEPKPEPHLEPAPETEPQARDGTLSDTAAPTMELEWLGEVIAQRFEDLDMLLLMTMACCTAAPEPEPEPEPLSARQESENALREYLAAMGHAECALQAVQALATVVPHEEFVKEMQQMESEGVSRKIVAEIWVAFFKIPAIILMTGAAGFHRCLHAAGSL